MSKKELKEEFKSCKALAKFIKKSSKTVLSLHESVEKHLRRLQNGESKSLERLEMYNQQLSNLCMTLRESCSQYTSRWKQLKEESARLGIPLPFEDEADSYMFVYNYQMFLHVAVRSPTEDLKNEMTHLCNQILDKVEEAQEEKDANRIQLLQEETFELIRLLSLKRVELREVVSGNPSAPDGFEFLDTRPVKKTPLFAMNLDPLFLLAQRKVMEMVSKHQSQHVTDDAVLDFTKEIFEFDEIANIFRRITAQAAIESDAQPHNSVLLMTMKNDLSIRFEIKREQWSDKYFQLIQEMQSLSFDDDEAYYWERRKQLLVQLANLTHDSFKDICDRHNARMQLTQKFI